MEIGTQTSVHVDVPSMNVDMNEDVNVIDPRPTADLRPARPRGSAACRGCASAETDFARNSGSSCLIADVRSHTSNLSVKPLLLCQLSCAVLHCLRWRYLRELLCSFYLDQLQVSRKQSWHHSSTTVVQQSSSALSSRLLLLLLLLHCAWLHVRRYVVEARSKPDAR